MFALNPDDRFSFVNENEVIRWPEDYRKVISTGRFREKFAKYPKSAKTRFIDVITKYLAPRIRVPSQYGNRPIPGLDGLHYFEMSWGSSIVTYLCNENYVFVLDVLHFPLQSDTSVIIEEATIIELMYAEYHDDLADLIKEAAAAEPEFLMPIDDYLALLRS